MTDGYADADPEETVTVSGVGVLTLHRAVRKHVDWREDHGLTVVMVYREVGKEPTFYDGSDLDGLAELERFC